MIFDELVNKINSLGVSYDIIGHAEIRSVSEGFQSLDILHEKVLKTIGFDVEGKYYFVVIPALQKVDYKKMSDIIGVKRKSICMILPDVLEKELGYQVGGVSPIHVDSKINVLVDRQICDMDFVFCGIGERDKTLKISSKDLIFASDALICDLIKKY